MFKLVIDLYTTKQIKIKTFQKQVYLKTKTFIGRSLAKLLLKQDSKNK